MYTFENIQTKPYGEKMFPRTKLTITNTVTYISGPNGSGKSTLMNMFVKHLQKSRAREFNMHKPSWKFMIGDDVNASVGFIHYNIHQDSHQNNMASKLFHGDIDAVSMQMSMSEGQNQLMTLSTIFDAAQHVAKYETHIKQLIVLVDGIDSGLSVDMAGFIRETVWDKIEQVHKHRDDLDFYLVFTANNYELVRDRTGDIIDPQTFKTVEYESYDDYVRQMQMQSYLR